MTHLVRLLLVLALQQLHFVLELLVAVFGGLALPLQRCGPLLHLVVHAPPLRLELLLPLLRLVEAHAIVVGTEALLRDPKGEGVVGDLEDRVRMQPVQVVLLPLVEPVLRHLQPVVGRLVLAAAGARRLLDGVFVLVLHAEDVVATGDDVRLLNTTDAQ